jgi:thiol-disulfide isomerase/thioredoxin
MKRLTLFLAGACACACAFALAGCGPGKEKEPPKPQVVAPLKTLGLAPAWQLKDLDGQVVSAEQFKGKVVVVDFWATWCGPCKIEIPGYIEMMKKHGPDGLVIIGVSVDDVGPDVVKAFVAKNKMNYPVLMYDEKVVEAFGGLEAIPTTFLIDRSGQIRDKKIGAEESASYERKILAVLKEPAAVGVGKR